MFDGECPPIKSGESEERAAARDKAKEELAMLSGDAPADLAKATSLRKASVSIRADIIAVALEYLRKEHQRIIGAPFESDAQLVSLEKQGIAHGSVSEDSDLFVYGSACLLTQLDTDSGVCSIVDRSQVRVPASAPPPQRTPPQGRWRAAAATTTTVATVATAATATATTAAIQ